MNQHTEFTRTRTMTSASMNTTTVAMVRGVLLWRRMRDSLGRAFSTIRESVSAQGWFVLAAAVVGAVCGVAFGWVEAFTASVIAAVLMLLALPFLSGAKSVEVLLALEHDRIVVGSAASGALVTRNIGKRPVLPGIVDLPVGDGLVELDVPLLAARATHETPVSIPGVRRGVVQIGPARTVRRDPLGLFHRERIWQDAQTLFIHPATVQLPAMSSGLIRDLEGQASSTIVPDDLSFHAIREYQPGDAWRHVHWKSTAKTGQLMVRQYEETRRSGITIVLGAREDEFRSPDEFELAVSVAGSLALRAMRDGREVRCVTSDEVPEFARATVGRITEVPARNPRMLLDHLAAVTSEPRMHTFPEVAAMTGMHTSQSSIAFLVSGSSLQASDLRRAAFGFPPHVTVVTIFCDQHAEPASWEIAGMRVLSVGILDDLGHLFARGLDG